MNTRYKVGVLSNILLTLGTSINFDNHRHNKDTANIVILSLIVSLFDIILIFDATIDDTVADTWQSN